jgi:hypothetical protein
VYQLDKITQFPFIGPPAMLQGQAAKAPPIPRSET